MHDAPALNLPRRAVVDKGSTGGQYKFLRCKDKVLVSTFNARTLHQPHSLGELSDSAAKQDIDVICIQEHRFIHDLKYDVNKVPNGYTLITSTATKNSAGAAVGGVGFLLNQKATRCLSSIDTVSPRIIVASFVGNPATTVICAYSPTNCSEEDEVVAFYKDMSDTARSIPPHNVLLVCGDFNAKLGSSDRVHYFHSQANRNGQHLQDYADEFNLVIGNTAFRKPQRKLWTFKYPDSTKAQIDYILVRKKWRNSLHNAEAYSTFSTVGSDHRIVTATIQLSLRAPKRKSNKHRTINFKPLCKNETLQQQYTIEVTNRFSSLENESCSIPDEDSYNRLSEACISAATTVLPKKMRSSLKNTSQSQRVQSARKTLHDAINKGEDLIKPREDLKQAYLLEEQQLLEEKISQVQHASHSSQHLEAWKVINDITGRKRSKTVPLRGSIDERNSAWLQHFRTLLGEPPLINNDDFDVSPIVDGELPITADKFTMDELDIALKQTRSGRAVGLDNIPLEIWKTEKFKHFLLKVCNKALIQHEIPTHWTRSAIIPIPKKGDLSNPANYRGISLTCVGAKIYNRMLLNRLRPHIDPILRWNQNGFRENRSTISQILALRRLLEGMKSKNLPLVAIFIDFLKAFDSIHRERMFMILQAYGIPDNIIKAVMIMYDNSSAIVMSNDGETEPFKTSAGVLQGDTLAPYLFIIVLDYVMRQALSSTYEETGIVLEPRRSRRHPEIRLHDLDFADDIALLASTMEKAESLLHSVESASNAVGLHLNEGKTKALLLNMGQTNNIKTKKGVTLENVPHFKYLGSYVPDSFLDFKSRKAQAWKACNTLEKIWKSNLNRQNKINVFRACVESILLYGSETWTITKILEARIDGCYTQLLRRALNISWKEHIPNKVVYGKLPPITSKIKARRLSFAGHCLRTADQPVAHLVFWTPTGGCSSRGRQRITYPDTIKNDIELEEQEIIKLMKDRKLWAQHVAAASSTPSTDD